MAKYCAGGFQLERGERHSNIQLHYYRNTKCLCKVSVRIWRIGAEDGESMQSCKVGSHEGQSDLLINKIVFEENSVKTSSTVPQRL